MELTEEEILNTYKPAQNDNIPQIQIGNLRQYANNLYPISLQKKPKKKKKKLKKTNKLEPLTTLRKRGTSTQTYKNHQTFRSRAYTNLKPQYLNDELKPEIAVKELENYLKNPKAQAKKALRIMNKIDKSQDYNHYFDDQNKIINTHKLKPEIPANPLVKINQNSQNVTIANIKINQDNQNQNSPPKQNKSNFQNYKKIMVCKPPNLSKNSTNQNFYKLNPPLPQINSSKNSNSKHKNIKNNKQNSQNQNNNNKNQNLNNINNNNQNQNQSLFNQNFLKYNAETLKKMNELNNKLSGHHTNQASGIPERSKFDLESIINAKYKPNQFSQQDKERQKINNKIHDIFNSLQSKLSQKPDFYNKSQLKQESQFNQFNSSQNQSSLNIQSTQD